MNKHVKIKGHAGKKIKIHRWYELPQGHMSHLYGGTLVACPIEALRTRACSKHKDKVINRMKHLRNSLCHLGFRTTEISVVQNRWKLPLLFHLQ